MAAALNMRAEYQSRAGKTPARPGTYIEDIISSSMRRLLAGLAFLCCAGAAFAAPIAVSGRVTGPEGERVPGVRVLLLPQPGDFARRSILRRWRRRRWMPPVGSF